ncbi:probable palmitoyltransferase ZDHHC24 [Drosophila guanche]|uniref:Palmitoyltransferase n=1 Tax=Drosophila guanche TaxID=7266 RepID=A0A3B0JQX2_DROGU|nr:probable palmitoyltransferase ZDHHC24 [Drosophila guanche]SPP75061.1 blast:Palmitoyltransferase PFA4 [Drosophila guanche]
MKIRSNPLPRRLADVLCFLLIGVFLPIVFIFEIVVVLPAFHEPGGFFHTFTFLMAMFLVFNIKGNMIACMMIDTSVDVKQVEPPPEQSAERLEWRECTECNRLAPPRSWHCKICGACILKRDHHCLYTGCCIGHRNHRFFMGFIFYLFLGSVYALVYNSIYMWIIHGSIYCNWLTLLKLTCPMLLLVTGGFWTNIYLLFYSLNVLALAYGVLLLGYHVPIVLRGGVSADRTKQRKLKYKRGVRKNLRSVFGVRMHIAWLSPLIRSDLPDDGYHWKATNSTTAKESKD